MMATPTLDLLVRAACVSRRAVVLSVVLLLAVLAAAAPPAAYAQGSLEDEHSPAVRARLYADLARDVEALEQQLGIIKRVVQLVGPTVVHIEAKKNSSFQHRYGSRAQIEEAGSGVIIELGGQKYVLTNRHVIRDANSADIKIRLHEGYVLQPRRVWQDEETDVAIMSVPDVDLLVPARLGNSAVVEIGDFVLAVGSPFGLSQSVTYGIVSAKGRYDLQLGDREGEVKYQNFLQTDAAINPGNSGGPLINLRGEVIGLNTAIASSSGGNEGIGFSIPINTAIHIGRQLVENNGKVARAFLGVTLDGQYAAARFAADGSRHIQGARVSNISAGSPAESVDIQAGDIIMAFDGIRIKDHDHLVNVVALTEVGREVNVVLRRDGEIRTVRVRVAPK